MLPLERDTDQLTRPGFAKTSLNGPCRRQAREETGVNYDVGDGTDQSPAWSMIELQAHPTPANASLRQPTPSSYCPWLMAHGSWPICPIPPFLSQGAAHTQSSVPNRLKPASQAIK